MSDQLLRSLVLRDPDDLVHGDDVGPKESTTFIYWAGINPQTQLNFLYRVIY